MNESFCFRDLKMDSNFNILIKWNGQSFSLDNISLELSLKDLKSLIKEQTNVLPDRQKLLNLKFKSM